jgi:putative tricarboxylic transport membrane protein
VVGKKKDPYYLITVTGLFLSTPLRGHTSFNFRDFTPVCNFAFDEHMLITHPKSKYQSLKEMISDAKANPKKVTFGGSFVGGAESFAAYNIEKAAGVKFNFIAFTGSGELMTQLLGGHLDLATANPCEALELEKAGKVRVLGLLAEKQYPEAPHIKTFRQQGVDAIGVGMNRGLAAPGGIPEGARKVLEQAFFKLTKTDTWQKYMKDNLLAEGWMDGPAFGKWLEKRNDEYAAIMKDMGLLKKK